MPKKIKETPLLGLNITTNPKDLKDHELSDMKNLRLLKTGELVRRGGLRPVNSSSLDNTDNVIRSSESIKYKQIYTPSKEYLDVFSIGNKVYLYDENINSFSLLYEAPGPEQVDIETYLGHILVTSHGSNLAILRRYGRNIYLMDKDQSVIRAVGVETDGILDIVAEDTISDSTIVDMDIDQSSLYTLNKTSPTLTPGVTPADQEITNVSANADNNYYGDISVFVGQDEIKTTLDYTGINSDVIAFSFEDFNKPSIDDMRTVNNYKSHNIVIKRYIDDIVWSMSLTNTDEIKWWYLQKLNYYNRDYWGQGTSINPVQKSIDNDYYVPYYRVQYIPTLSSYNIKHKVYIDNTEVTQTSVNESVAHGIRTITFNFHISGGISIPIKVVFSNSVITNEYVKSVFSPSITNSKSISFDGDTNDELWRGFSHYSKADLTKMGVAQDPFTGFYFTRIFKTSGNESDHVKELAWDIKNILFSLGSDYVPAKSTTNSIIIDTPISPENATIGKLTDGPVVLNPYKPFYRIESSLGDISKTLLQDSSGNSLLDDTNIRAEITTLIPLVLDFTFDMEFNDLGVGLEKEYQVIIGDDTYDNLEIKKYSKDNFDIKSNLLNYRTSGLTEQSLSKITRNVIYINDSIGQYLIAIKRDGIKTVIQNIFTLDAFNFVGMRTFTSHLGRLYIAIISDNNIRLYTYVNSEIVNIDTLGIPDVIDITTENTNESTIIHGIRNNDLTTFKAILSTDFTNGYIKWDEVLITDIEKELDMYINMTSPYPNTIALVKNSSSIINIITNDLVGTPTYKNKSLEYQVSGAITNTFTKIISDLSFSAIKQIKPISTPVRPEVIISAGAITGKYVYMYVVDELYWTAPPIKGNRTRFYESYASDYSIIVNVNNQNVTLPEKIDGYISKSAGIIIPDGYELGMEVSLYRAVVIGDKTPKLTDFFLLETKDVENVKDIPAFTDSLADASALSKYIGYTEYYPRCAFVSTLNNVVFLANDREYQNNVYFSDIFDPTKFQPQNTLSAELFTNDNITGIASADGIYVFTQDSVTLISGSGLSYVTQILTREFGCVDSRTIQVIGGNLVFLSERGIIAGRGLGFNQIDTPVSAITHKLTKTSKVISYYDNFSQEYRLIFDNNKMLIFSVPLKTWFMFVYPYDKIEVGFTRENKNTDIQENILIISNDDNTFRMLVEDNLLSTDFLRLSGVEDGSTVTNKIDTYFYTKAFAGDSGMIESLWRRIFIDSIKTHEIEGFISVDDGEFRQLIQQRKRNYFKEVPYIWLRLSEYFGNKAVDSGVRSLTVPTYGVVSNRDGKIDRAYQFDNNAYINLGNVNRTNEATIVFWIKPDDTENRTAIGNLTEPDDFGSGDKDVEAQIFTLPGALTGDPATGIISDVDFAWDCGLRCAEGLVLTYGTLTWDSEDGINWTGRYTATFIIGDNSVGGQIKVTPNGKITSISIITTPLVFTTVGIGSMQIEKTFMVK